MATTYHQLGMLAQNRGDLAEAEMQFKRTLDIDERMGNQAGMAATISQLGFVAAERNELEQAIGLHGRALVIRVRIGIPEVRIDARQPRELRRLVSAESFARGLVTTVGENGAGQLVELLDGLDKAEDTDG